MLPAFTGEFAVVIIVVVAVVIIMIIGILVINIAMIIALPILTCLLFRTCCRFIVVAAVTSTIDVPLVVVVLMSVFFVFRALDLRDVSGSD